jgi:hypothetical protein
VETVRAILEEGDEEVTVWQVARLLGLDKSTALRRVNEATKRSFPENRETHGGRPYHLVIGEPLPDNVEILPPAEALAKIEQVARHLSSPPYVRAAASVMANGRW